MTTKIRIYELAKELKVDSKRIIEDLQRIGVSGGYVPSSSIDQAVANRIRERYNPNRASTDTPSANPQARQAAVRNHSAQRPTALRPHHRANQPDALPTGHRRYQRPAHQAWTRSRFANGEPGTRSRVGGLTREITVCFAGEDPGFRVHAARRHAFPAASGAKTGG